MHVRRSSDAMNLEGEEQLTHAGQCPDSDVMQINCRRIALPPHHAASAAPQQLQAAWVCMHTGCRLPVT